MHRDRGRCFGVCQLVLFLHDLASPDTFTGYAPRVIVRQFGYISDSPLSAGHVTACTGYRTPISKAHLPFWTLAGDMIVPLGSPLTVLGCIALFFGWVSCRCCSLDMGLEHWSCGLPACGLTISYNAWTAVDSRSIHAHDDRALWQNTSHLKDAGVLRSPATSLFPQACCV